VKGHGVAAAYVYTMSERTKKPEGTNIKDLGCVKPSLLSLAVDLIIAQLGIQQFKTLTVSDQATVLERYERSRGGGNVFYNATTEGSE
jgi:hypothetical protein